MAINIPRGTQDLLPGQIEKWQYIESVARDLCKRFQFEEIRTPMFESTELFVRGVGDTTDIVQKEMYTFEDRKGRSMTLRPEGTAPVVRSYVEQKMFGYATQPVKLFYLAQIFRYERPQAGRYRQHHQFGVEVLGSNDPATDAEVISLAVAFFQKLGLKNLKVAVNSLGDKDSRNAHRHALINHFEPRIGEFCGDCQKRLEKNPLRILDCKVDRDHELLKTAPSIIDYLNEESQTRFNKVKMYLNSMGIQYEVDPNLVRGLDYYNHTVFEIMLDSKGFGAITTLCGGGRYNGLVEQIGGPETPGIGFGLGLERLLLALETEGVELPIEKVLDCYIVTYGEEAKDASVKILHDLRSAGLSADRDFMGRSAKAQFKAADRSGARFVAMLGENELTSGKITVKNMATSEQVEVLLEELAGYIKG
ncbi:MAG: hisS [Bacillales bacterium]|jgi:histidyl-tRNA synthetase|nr:hisS [Bacillales bacterium]